MLSANDAYLVAVSPNQIASQLEGAAIQGKDWGIAIGSYVIALFLFVTFLSIVFHWFRS